MNFHKLNTFICGIQIKNQTVIAAQKFAVITMLVPSNID